jgi:pimeloyl-ACP methyl ester carboxylesterase
MGIALAACGSSGGTTKGSPSSVPPASQPAASTPAPSVTPFETQSSLPLDPRNKGSKVVSFTSIDGIALTGRMYGSGPHGVVLAPSGNVRYSQFEWLPVAVRLEKVGYRVLTFDVRGICYAPDPNVGCSQGEIDWGNAWKDVAGAVGFLRAQGAKTVSVVGADLGGTEALFAASKGTKVDGIVTVSGLDDTEGYSIDASVLGRVGAPVLLIAGRGDVDAAEAYRSWLREAPAPAKGVLLDTDLRGTFIFDPLAPSDIPQAKRALQAVEEFLQFNG